MKEFLIINILILLFKITFAQKSTIYGTIKTNEGEELIGASIYVKELKTGTTSNNYGVYSLSIPQGKYELNFLFLGYKSLKINIELKQNTVLNVELENQTTEINEITIKDDKKDININNAVLGLQNLNIATIKTLPVITGEPDLLKSIQLLPGIQTANEGTTNLSIRGGSYDQNLILLDEAPVYNASHTLSLISIFNSDAIKNVEIYKGLYPPQYGGKASSVVDIRMKEGNNKNISVSGGIGLIASRLTIESPIQKEKSAFIISGRYSYAGFIVNNMGDLGKTLNFSSLKNFNDQNEINFYDINAKLNFQINDKNRLFFSIYSGNDHFYYFDINNNSSMDWGNITNTLRWNHFYGNKLFSNLSIIYSKYDYSYILKDDARRFKWSAGRQLYSFKYDFDYFYNPKHSFKFGVNVDYNSYRPGKIEPRDSLSITKEFTLNNKQAVNLSTYISDEFKMMDNFTIIYGLRQTIFFNIGPDIVYTYSKDMSTAIDSTNYKQGKIIQFYNGLEPYLTFRYLISNQSSLKAGYSRKFQFEQLISNSTIGLPTDVWLPADKYIQPIKSDNFSIGYFRNFLNNTYEFSVETYYRKINQIIDYKDNAELFLNAQIETQILSGKVDAYGLETFISKKTGWVNGFISYTLSNATQKIDGINNDNAYSPSYNKRHNLSANMNVELGSKYNLSCVFKYISGGFVTIPEGIFNHYGASFVYYSDRNAYELPPYHSLDLSIKRTNTSKKGYYSEWIFTINNVYNRKNIFSLYFKQDDVDLNTIKAYKIYLFGIFPSITYNFKF